MLLPDATDELTFHDSPAWIWLIAAASAMVGIGLLALAAQGIIAEKLGRQSLAALGGGLAGIAMAVYGASRAERTSLQTDVRARRLYRIGTLLWRQRRQEWSFDEIDTIEPEQWDDGEGKPLWRPVLVLRNGKRIPLIANWRRDEDQVKEICAKARRLMTPADPGA